MNVIPFDWPMNIGKFRVMLLSLERLGCKQIENTLLTFHEQQRKEGMGPYHFLRVTDRAYDTVGWGGYGAPVKPCGLIVSTFRPSD